MDLLREKNASELWCYARSAAVEFYRKQGFIEEGEEFEADHQPHVFMWRKIAGADFYATVTSRSDK